MGQSPPPPATLLPPPVTALLLLLLAACAATPRLPPDALDADALDTGAQALVGDAAAGADHDALDAEALVGDASDADANANALDAHANALDDGCDWRGSGLSGPERGVSPVYLRCAQGRLDWSYPRGALRVLLRLGGAGHDFRGCVRLGERAAGARLFLEGPRSLAPLFDDADGAPRRLARCFRSRGGQAALYVESVPAPAGDFTKRVMSFTYDLEPLPRGAKGYDPAEQCRPCTKEEMSRAFCTSDLVARGIIRGVQNKPELEVTELNVKVTKMLRRSTDAAGGLCGENEVSPLGDCEGYEETPSASATPAAPTAVSLQVPVHCGARHGSGEFVFMARRKLGELALTCAPRLQDWVAAVRDLEAAGEAHCVLAS